MDEKVITFNTGICTSLYIEKDKTNPQMHSAYLYFKGKKVIAIIKQIINKKQARCSTKHCAQAHSHFIYR